VSQNNKSLAVVPLSALCKNSAKHFAFSTVYIKADSLAGASGRRYDTVFFGMAVAA
jgi:hypothetical protein